MSAEVRGGRGEVDLGTEITLKCVFSWNSMNMYIIRLDFSIERGAHTHGDHDHGQHIDVNRNIMIHGV